MEDLLTVLLIGVGLAADAFAVSVSNSMTKPKLTNMQFVSYPICFGVFQGLMPLLGYFVGSAFTELVSKVDHWIALVLLAFIGGKMIIESAIEIKKKKAAAKTANANNGDNGADDGEILPKTDKIKGYSFGEMVVQGVATSIDALVVGITLALTVSMSIYYSVLIIAVVTFAISLVGMFLGKKVGKYLSDYAGIIGGAILVGIGLKIFIEHIIAL